MISHSFSQQNTLGVVKDFRIKIELISCLQV